MIKVVYIDHSKRDFSLEFEYKSLEKLIEDDYTLFSHTVVGSRQTLEVFTFYKPNEKNPLDSKTKRC